MKAIKMFSKASKCHREGRVFQAFLLHNNGLHLMSRITKKEKHQEKRSRLIAELQTYVIEGENIKEAVRNLTTRGSLMEEISIPEDSQQHSYENVFGRFFERKIMEMHLDEPQLVTLEEFQNLIAFMEVVATHCPKFKYIHIGTNLDQDNENQQKRYLEKVRQNLARNGILMSCVRIKGIQKCKIALNDGVIIKVRPSLHFFKPPCTTNSLDSIDYDFRKCKNSTIGIYSVKEN